MAHRLARREENAAVVEDGPDRDTVQDHPPRRPGGQDGVRLTAASKGIQHLDGDKVRHGGHGSLGQLLCRALGVVGGADTRLGLKQDPLPGRIPVGRAVRHQTHRMHPAVRILQRGQGRRPAALRTHAPGAQQIRDMLHPAPFQHQAHRCLGPVAQRVRRELRQTPPTHHLRAQLQRTLQTGIRPHQPQIPVKDPNAAGKLVQHPLPEHPVLRQILPRQRRRPPGRSRHHQPLGRRVTGRMPVCQQPPRKVPTVPMPQHRRAAPPPAPGRDPLYPLPDVVGQQSRRRAPHHLRRSVPQESPGPLAPPRHDAPLIHRGRARLLRRDTRPCPLARRGGRSRHHRSSRRSRTGSAP